ncbi:MAG: HTH domain-containing protein [Pirellulales bacterium]
MDNRAVDGIRAALDHIQNRRNELRRDMEGLEATERCLRSELERLSGSQAVNPTAMEIGLVQAQDTGGNRSVEGLSDDATKHEAAEAVLRQTGEPMKVAAMVEVLRRSEYGRNLQPRILHNALHTAMGRKTETFKKISPGVWSLKEWGESPTINGESPGGNPGLSE